MEGRRAVGKSSLARHLTEAGTYASYQSLTDPAAAERARRDALGWVRSLRRPAVIDEAQVVPAVSMAVKELVDRGASAGWACGASVLLRGGSAEAPGSGATTTGAR